ncbi:MULTISPECIES: hypothetical protein [unclassified Bradyrhizobium]|uniref:hypothetical protein n=1 Tax=unclassified Bradyrhizobium TaxID=2631580 RepID=UPI001BAB90DE|nr:MULTISPECIES: hypothetical protein [unclassified Bradyrhizobium]MBR1203612.1 hypothetical protein [Bradyrhizobium sp. AUGA SZCCT0124]MBR1313275.1 hypothetical protein [Bradyrhizobium sp. AUGA SZCCT0051]MBR1341633.1 hypothetical protein [Bradyrhizobium sp. AUGA SZCCT0105]MBR1356429.1 hypothetical protein [Bradyrhizobium sp. AUGA SZCCT0045]
MTGLTGSLSIALSLVGSIWLVGVVALLVGAPGELVAATFVVGLVTGVAEWRGMIRKSGCRFSQRQTRSVCAEIMPKLEAEHDDRSSCSGKAES